MIDLIDVSKSYGKGLPAVNHANLHVDKGEFVHGRLLISEMLSYNLPFSCFILNLQDYITGNFLFQHKEQLKKIMFR